MEPIRVLLVDDNPTFLRLAARFLRQHCNDEVEVVGVLSEGRAAVQEAPKLQPEVILLDLSMPDLPGLKAIPLLRAELPEVRIIILTLLDTNGYRKAAQSAGADGFVPKATLGNDLLPTIRQVLQTDQPQEATTDGNK